MRCGVRFFSAEPPPETEPALYILCSIFNATSLSQSSIATPRAASAPCTTLRAAVYQRAPRCAHIRSPFYIAHFRAFPFLPVPLPHGADQRQYRTMGAKSRRTLIAWTSSASRAAQRRSAPRGADNRYHAQYYICASVISPQPRRTQRAPRGLWCDE
jgi:hypothetical protein